MIKIGKLNISKRNDICKLGGYKNEITKENEKIR